MHFIFGGRCMGKLEYAKSLLEHPAVCDLSEEGEDGLFAADIVDNIHLLIRRMLLAGGNPLRFFSDNMERLEEKILIGDEVGSGVVPVEPFEREWRDETGRIYQLLAKHARRVTRVWAGISEDLKRDGARP